jgi:L-rhamnose mutarotase
MNSYPRLFLLFFLVGLSALSCQKETHNEKTKDLVFVVNLVDDEQKVKEYLAYHHKIWPEVEAGFKKAGYKKIKLYRFNKSIVMVVTVLENADLNRMGQVAEAYDKKCKEWNQRMNGYQVGVSGVAPGQKWAQTEEIYSFINP